MSPAAHAPSVRFRRDGTVAASASGCFDWALHRGGAPLAYLTTSLAGLGSSESLEASVEVEVGSEGTVTTQGPSSMLRTEADATHRWRLRVGPDGHLTFLPWLTLPYPGSRSTTEVLAELAAGATLCAWDVLAVGRIARGERLELAGLRARFAIDGPGGRLLDDRLGIDGRSRECGAAALGGLTHLGTLYLAGLPEERLPVTEARACLGELELADASRPDPSLLVVRALDRSAERIERVFWPLVVAARRAAGAAPLAPEAVARRWLGTPAAPS